ncbi:MAG TPA: proline-rich domain-containing protein [Planctomycetota bacterium]|nr:proline-rich domain-containing protein [Planctomycetota bacterium]
MRLDSMARKRGSALVIVTLVSAITLVIIVASLTEGVSATQYAGLTVREARLRYACEAGLAAVRDMIAYPQYAGPPYQGGPSGPPPFTAGSPQPGYQGSANLWLRGMVSTPAGQNYWQPLFPPRASASVLPRPTLQVTPSTPSGGQGAPINVWVWANDVYLDIAGNPIVGPAVAGDTYRLAAYAEMPSSGFYDPSSGLVTQYDRLLLIQDLRESQPFSAYMFFTFNSDLYVGNVTVNGNILSNKKIVFPATGNVTVTEKATAVGGFFQTNGSGLAPLTNPNVVMGSSSSGGATVPLPATGVASEDALAQAATNGRGPNFYSLKKQSGGFPAWQSLSGPNINATVTIHNNAGSPPTLDITATGSTGGTQTFTGVPYPDAGVLYVDGNVTVSAPNGFSGKLTVVSGSGDLTIASNLQYKDPNSSTLGNEYAFNLYDPSTSTVLDPATTSGSWAGYQYVPNTTFSGPATSLGLMAYNSIKTASTAPNNLLVNGSIYAYKGSPLDAVSQGTAKGNLAVAGSLVGYTTGARTNTIDGYNQSGLYAWDQKASQSPPPGWLSTPAPAFGAIHRRNSALAPASFLHDGTNTAAGGPGT